MTDDLDLSPRAPAPDPDQVGSRRKRNWMPIVVLAMVLIAGGVIVAQFLRSAVDYYCNVDEVGVRDGCDDTRRIRLQGTVDEGSVGTAAGATVFTISFNGSTMPVRYDGEPGGIFRECLPVVVHGTIENGELQGDRVEVRHSDEYVSVNDERVQDATDVGCDTTGGESGEVTEVDAPIVDVTTTDGA
jgi:cytochrome c-type biogenesis protein CcmE